MLLIDSQFFIETVDLSPTWLAERRFHPYDLRLMENEIIRLHGMTGLILVCLSSQDLNPCIAGAYEQARADQSHYASKLKQVRDLLNAD